MAAHERIVGQTVEQLNDPDHGADVRIRVTRYLFPHGCLWWRECPNCGKLSSYIGDEWSIGSPTLLPPPPLKAFTRDLNFKSWTLHLRKPKQDESNAWSEGKADARACVHCRTLTFAHDTSFVAQTNFKAPPPPFLQEIQREMRIVVQNAGHIVLRGYSLPPDDVSYRAFLAARKQRDKRPPVRCSIVDFDSRFPDRWLYPPELSGDNLPRVVHSAQSLFERDNVRFYGGGIPRVFHGAQGRVADDAVDRLLRWD